MLIQQRMGDITKLLDQAKLDTATDGQKACWPISARCSELLLDEKSDKDKIREEFERLSEWKKQIENILQQERGEKRESDKLANKEKTQADLQAKIKALENVIAQQKEVIARNGRTPGPKAFKAWARSPGQAQGDVGKSRGDRQSDRQGSRRREGTV